MPNTYTNLLFHIVYFQHDTPVAPSRGLWGSTHFDPGARAPGYNMSSLRD